MGSEIPKLPKTIVSQNIRKKLQSKITKYSEQKSKGKSKLCPIYLN
jgi:hypothetical protein